MRVLRRDHVGEVFQAIWYHIHELVHEYVPVELAELRNIVIPNYCRVMFSVYMSAVLPVNAVTWESPRGSGTRDGPTLSWSPVIQNVRPRQAYGGQPFVSERVESGARSVHQVLRIQRSADGQGTS